MTHYVFVIFMCSWKVIKVVFFLYSYKKGEETGKEKKKQENKRKEETEKEEKARE